MAIAFCRKFNNWGIAFRPAFVVVGLPFMTISWWR